MYHKKVFMIVRKYFFVDHFPRSLSRVCAIPLINLLPGINAVVLFNLHFWCLCLLFHKYRAFLISERLHYVIDKHKLPFDPAIYKYLLSA